MQSRLGKCAFSVILVVCTVITPCLADEMALDLHSTDLTHVASGSETVSITSGNETHEIAPGQMLTPAQFVAYQQVVSGLGQTLILDGSGRASGGTFNASSFGNLASLMLPSGVTALADSASQLMIAGNLHSAGTLLGIGTAGGLNISAGSVSVLPGGSITTVVPEHLVAFYPGNILNLSIFSASDILNQGTISASGVLNLSAVGSIINEAVAGAQLPVMSGAQGMNILAGNGIIQNAGLMQAITGNINFSTLAGRDLNIQNIAGVISAVDGVINVRDSLYAAKDLTSITGGILAADRINLFGGDGALSANVSQFNGPLHIQAGTANILVQNGVINLQQLSLSGDPLIANSEGDIFLPDLLQFNGEHLAIVARGNILHTTGGVLQIDLSSTTGDAGNLSMIAGYDFIDNGSNNITITGPSDIGGSIFLRDVTINTSAIDGRGGDVLMVAHAGIHPDPMAGPTAINEGVIQIGQNASNQMINTSSVNGTAGSVTVIAHSDNIAQTRDLNGFTLQTGGTSSSFVDLGDGEAFFYGPGNSSIRGGINTSSQNGAAGSIAFYGSAPQMTAETVVFQNGLRTGDGTFAPTREGGQLVVTPTTFQEHNRFLAGNIDFQGDINASGPLAQVNFELGGRNVTVEPIEILNVSGNINIHGQDHVRIETGLFNTRYIAGLTSLDEDPVFDNLNSVVDPTAIIQPGSINITSGGDIILDPFGPTLISNGGDIRIVAGRTVGQVNNCEGGCNNAIFIARGGNVVLNAVTGNIEMFPDLGTLYVARALNQPNSGGGIALVAGVALTNELSTLLQAQALSLPAPNPNIYNENPESEGYNPHDPRDYSVDPASGWGNFVTVRRVGEPETSNWATMSRTGPGTEGVLTDDTVTFNNGALLFITQGQSTIEPGSNFFMAAPAAGILPPPPPPPPGVVPPIVLVVPPTVSPPGTPPSSPGTPVVAVLLPSGPTNGLIPVDVTNDPPPLVRGSNIICTTVALSESKGSKDNDDQKDESTAWFVAAESCQSCSLDLDGNPSLLLNAGSKVARTGKYEVTIGTGRVAVLSGDHAVQIKTGYGTVNIDADSAAIVERTERGVVRVATLQGRPSTFTPVGHPEKVLNSAQGEELVLCDSTVDDEELIPTDGVDRQMMVSGQIAIASEKEPNAALKMRKNKFDPKQMMAKNPSFSCTTCISTPTKKRLKELKEPNARQTPPVVINPTTDTQPAASSKTLLPVAYTTSAAPALSTSSSLVKATTGGAQVRHSGTVALTVRNDGTIEAGDGEALISTDSHMARIDLGTAKLTLQPGCEVLLHKRGSQFLLKNLHDRHGKSVCVNVSGRRIFLAPGQELAGGPVTAGIKRKGLHEAIQKDNVGRRRIVQHDFDKDSVVLSEFSMASALLESNVLSSLRSSTRSDDRDCYGRILKMAACTMHATRAHGGYAHARKAQ